MARIRTVKPEFWTSPQIAECSPNARLLFIGMWNFCDDAGVHPGSTQRLKMEVFPSDPFTIPQITGWVDELIAQGLIVEYEANHKSYWRVTGWNHQKIDRPTYRYPADGSPTTRQPLDEVSPPEGKGRESKGRDNTPAPGGAAPPDGIAIVLPMAENAPAPPSGGTPTELVVSDPKPPAENAAPAQTLSWFLYEGRQKLYDDQFYDPWNGKALGICKTLIEKKARGNFKEALGRLRVLFLKCSGERPGNDYWAFTPENFTLKWSQLVGDPILRIEKPSREALARAGYEERIRALTQEMRDETT